MVSSDDLLRQVRTVHPRAEKISDELIIVFPSRGLERLECRTDGRDWLWLCEDIAPIRSFDRAALLGLLAANRAPSRWRFAGVGKFVGVRADFPLCWEPVEELPALLRGMHETAERVRAGRAPEGLRVDPREQVFRCGHLGELDDDVVLDLLFANHESRHFRVALDEKGDVYLISNDERLAPEFDRACADLAEDLAGLVE